MTTAYLRVSSDKQTTQNQRFEIEEYAKRNGILVDEWVEEVISGTKHHSHRKLGRLIKRLRKDDTLILSELSRLSRNLMGIFSVLNVCMERGVRIIAIKERYELGNSIEAKVLAFAFALAAEIERNLISIRTREALARKRAEGVLLGRPKGKFLKLNGREDEIRQMLTLGASKADICRRLRTSRTTLHNFIRRKEICAQFIKIP